MNDYPFCWGDSPSEFHDRPQLSTFRVVNPFNAFDHFHPGS